MNLLIVDDEYYSMESIRCKLTEKYSIFDNIFGAYNLSQALGIFEKNDIAILISDIEMPGGTGLDLLDHIRKQDLCTICIFLTAHARFEYVSKAMKLSSSDYLLKPVSDEQLFEAVDHAVTLYQDQKRNMLNTIQAGYWKQSERYLMEQFWYELLTNAIPNTQSDLTMELKHRGLDPEQVSRLYYLLLIQDSPKETLCITGKMEKSLYEFTLKNIFQEYFYQKEELPVVIRIFESFFLLPLPALTRNQPQLVLQCQSALADITSHITNSFNFFVPDKPLIMTELPQLLIIMKTIAHENVLFENHVFDLAQSFVREKQVTLEPFPSKHWSDLLLTGYTAALQDEVLAYLSRLQRSETITREHLSEFYYLFLHMMLSSIPQEHAPAFRKLQKKLYGDTQNHPWSSIRTMREWIFHIIIIYEECLASTRVQHTAVSYVCTYVHEHLQEELDRDTLAAQVYLNPDYLSHIFKKETGFSLTNYIMNERIEKAKQLLIQKEKSIRDISIACGFQSISYFSKQFKKYTGMTPREFRG